MSKSKNEPSNNTKELEKSSNLEEHLETENDDIHAGCYSWPNCDIHPNGCVIRMGKDVEQFGFK